MGNRGAPPNCRRRSRNRKPIHRPHGRREPGARPALFGKALPHEIQPIGLSTLIATSIELLNRSTLLRDAVFVIASAVVRQVAQC